jgi:hypothetical protein
LAQQSFYILNSNWDQKISLTFVVW